MGALVVSCSTARTKGTPGIVEFLMMNVLLVRPDGIGDQIVCLPVAAALRRLVPGVKVAFLSSAYAAPIFDHHPDVDRIVPITGNESFRESIRLFRSGFDAAVFLKPFKSLMLAAWIARVPLRIATGYRWYSVLANRRVYQHRRDFSKHETEYNLGLLSGLGLKPGSPVRPKLVVTTSERQAAEARMSRLSAKRVILHPGGFAARRWRGEHYWRLAHRLVYAGFGVVLTGTAPERERFYRESIAPGVMPGMLDVMGELNVRELMAVIGSSHVVVSGATGPAHLAAALGVPTVSLFDPRRNNLPLRWQPMGKGVVLRPNVPTCETCSYEACPYWDCLDRISETDVAERVREIIGRAADSMTVVHV